MEQKRRYIKRKRSEISDQQWGMFLALIEDGWGTELAIRKAGLTNWHVMIRRREDAEFDGKVQDIITQRRECRRWGHDRCHG